MPVTLTLDAARAQIRAGQPVTDAQLERLAPEARRRLEREVRAWLLDDRKRNPIEHYRIVNREAVKVHTSMAREVGIQGGNKCQPGTTRVLTGRGIVPLSEVKPGDVVPVSGRNGVVVDTYVSPEPVAVYRVVTRRGYVMRASAEHPVMMAAPCPRAWHGGQYADGASARWVEAAEVRPGEYIRLMFLGAFPEACEITAGDAYFLGLMTGDGSWCGPSAVMSLTTADEDIAAWVRGYLGARGVHTWVTAKAGSKASSVGWCRADFKALLASWGVAFHRSTAKRVPDSIWRGTRDVVAAFIRGYADTDGCATTKPSVVWTSACEALLEDVQKLLLRFAIVSSRRACKPNGRFRSWRLEAAGRNAARYAGAVGFTLARKAARLPAPPKPGKPQWTKWDRVVSVERVADEVVYGLTVSPEPVYEADGFLQHNSGKTGTVLAEFVIQATGIVPRELADVYPREKLRGLGHPITARLVVTSLVSAWDTNLKRKLQWFAWNGRMNEHQLAGDPRYGHWGWIPQRWLIHGSWDDSWSEKHRTLTLWHPERREPWSTLQIMSHDQSLSEFNQGAFDLIIEDELPDEEIHRANRIRAMEKHGQIYVGGTPSDERAGAVMQAWFFDQIVAPGLEGSNPEQVEAIVLHTEDNETLDAQDIAAVAAGLTEEQKRARLHGETIHLSGLIVKGFTERARTWCFTCAGSVVTMTGACVACQGRDVATYSHVWDERDLAWPGPASWPVLFYMDPHQARPTACAWYKVDPNDAWWQIAEADIAGDASVVKQTCEALEAEHGWHVAWRKGDPKITAQTNQFARDFGGQTFTIRRAFEEVGFEFGDANTNFTVALDRLHQALRPDPLTRTPRLRIHRTCAKTIYHLTHHVWREDKPSKQWSDFVAVTRYMVMDEPDWRSVQSVLRAEPITMVRLGAKRSVTGW